MSAQALKHTPFLQQALEAGVLSPAQAWALMWELEVLRLAPWTPGVRQINQTVTLFHLDLSDQRRH